MHGTLFAEIYNSFTHVRRARGKVIETHIYIYTKKKVNKPKV